jgi:hypothetical protein
MAHRPLIASADPPAIAISEGRVDSFQRMMDRLLSDGLVLAVVAVTIQTAAHLLNAAFIGTVALNANAEGNVFAWASGAALVAAALACALHAWLVQDGRRAFVAVAAMLAFLSLDEMTAIHERIVARVVELGDLPIAWDSVLWPVLYAPLVGAVFVLLLVLASAAPPRAGRFIVVGLGLLVAAVVAEVASAPVSTGSNWPHVLEGAVEEAAELGGWIVIATALAVISLTALRGVVAPRPHAARR